MWQTVLEYAVSIGFPNANHYGNDANHYGEDGGITFGPYSGSLCEGVAQHDVLVFSQANGFPNASLYGDPVIGVAF